MLSLALKNGMIMIIIIMTLHIVVRNYIYDKRYVSIRSESQTVTQDNLPKPADIKTTTSLPMNVTEHMIMDESPVEDELLKYIEDVSTNKKTSDTKQQEHKNLFPNEGIKNVLEESGSNGDEGLQGFDSTDDHYFEFQKLN